VIAGPLRVLVLGGTGEARALADRLAPRVDVAVTSSLAGRVADPVLPTGNVRIGGFGGVEGLAAFLTARRIDAIVDATHPFAEAISRNAAEAAARTGIPLLALRRPPWEPRDGDRWHLVADTTGAAQVAPHLGKRIFLTLGRQGCAPFASCEKPWFLIRALEPPAAPLPPRHELLLQRGPFTIDEERSLLRQHRIDVLVSKNSGGDATSAKLVAARELGLPVVLVRRPPVPDVPSADDVSGAVTWIDRLLGTGATVT
jgi:precorrin-6A/cobalt-precorrin-6A reductase